MATVFIPSLLQDLTHGEHRVVVPGATVRQVLAALEERFPGLRARLTDGDRIRPNISVAVDGEMATMGVLEKVGESSEVHFLPAIGGGAGQARQAQATRRGATPLQTPRPSRTMSAEAGPLQSG